jgi:hypothetical protein
MHWPRTGRDRGGIYVGPTAVHTSLRAFAGDALRAMATQPSNRDHDAVASSSSRLLTENRHQKSIRRVEDSLVADVATLSNALSTANHHPLRRGDRTLSRSPHQSANQPRVSAPMDFPLTGDGGDSEGRLFGGSHAVRIRVQLQIIWDEIVASREMRAAIEWHLSALSALEERFAIERRSESSTPVMMRANDGRSINAPPVERIEHDMKLHLYYLEEHLALVLEEQKIRRAVREKLAYRTRLMEQLKVCSSKYRTTVTQHIMLARQQQSKQPYPNVFSAPRHVGPTSSAIIQGVLQEVHHLLDAYRTVTVEIIELHAQWRRWTLSGNFFGAASRQHSSAKWEASSTNTGPDPWINVPQEFHRKAFQTRARERFVLSSYHGQPLLEHLSRDLFLSVFDQEPLHVLLGCQVDWNPLALPGQRWTLVGACTTAASQRAIRERLESKPRTQAQGATHARSSFQSSALASLFSRYAKDHRWRALLSEDDETKSEVGPNGRTAYLTYFAREHKKILHQRANIKHTNESQVHAHLDAAGTTPIASSFSPATFVIPSPLFRYAQFRSSATSTKSRQPQGISTLVEDQYERCAVAMEHMRQDLEQHSVIRIQALIRGIQCRQGLWDQLVAIVTIQRYVRGMLGRRQAHRLVQLQRRRAFLKRYLVTHSAGIALSNADEALSTLPFA